jgi:2,3-bisphosphoglycerate-dependent phosphoglycerate mutase
MMFLDILNRGLTVIVKKSFYFLRHAETEHNQQGLCAGSQIDSFLTQQGIHQAQKLQDKIRDLDVNGVISSPLIRTRHTAAIATQALHPIMIEPDLREWDLGDFEGAPISDFVTAVDTLPSHVPLPNGESKNQLAHRVLSGLNRWLTTHGNNILVVSHGLVFLALLEYTKTPVTFLGNAELVHFVPEDEGWSVRLI